MSLGFKRLTNKPARYMGWDRVIGIATRHRLDGSDIESWWRRYFLHPSTPALGLTQSPTLWVQVHSMG